jgi:hypothetical protein
MNAKQLFTAAALAVLGTTAFASEAIQVPVEAGQLTRAEVKADLARAQAAGEIVSGEAYGSFPAVGVAARKASFDNTVARSADDVRVEARAANRAGKFNELYVGG